MYFFPDGSGGHTPHNIKPGPGQTHQYDVSGSTRADSSSVKVILLWNLGVLRLLESRGKQ